uniref:Uncharacterized protein n=1 Tax=Aegilops tauschii subsp. strangulata TaxID=200361 RepID=A0A453SRJ1_AEGTS
PWCRAEIVRACKLSSYFHAEVKEEAGFLALNCWRASSPVIYESTCRSATHQLDQLSWHRG